MGISIDGGGDWVGYLDTARLRHCGLPLGEVPEGVDRVSSAAFSKQTLFQKWGRDLTVPPMLPKPRSAIRWVGAPELGALPRLHA